MKIKKLDYALNTKYHPAIIKTIKCCNGEKDKDVLYLLLSQFTALV